MAMVAPSSAPALPTGVAPLPRLFAYAQALGLEPYLARARRGMTTLTIALIWLTLARRGSGRPYHLNGPDEPLLAPLLGRGRLPSPSILYRGTSALPAHALRAAVDAHQLPYWDRG